MKDLNKYKGIIPAFYACYDEQANVSLERTADLVNFLADKGVKGLYVCGSSGECIYQGVEERKAVLETVVKTANGRLTIIAHVACNNTKDSMALAAHAQSLGVDAIASIPPIYFKLPDQSIAKYWNDISSAAPNTDFIIYNIPQLAGVALSMSLLNTMLENPNVIGVKNSSMPVQDIQMFKMAKNEDFVVFNGPDEQFISGRLIGADGGIGGTYAVMPELFLLADELLVNGEIEKAREVQIAINEVIYAMCDCGCNMYAAAKEILRLQGVNCGGVRAPLKEIDENGKVLAANVKKMIDVAIQKFC